MSTEPSPSAPQTKPGRLMSVTLTEQAVLERRKTVTRRLGWQYLLPGAKLQLVRNDDTAPAEPRRSPRRAGSTCVQLHLP